MSGKILNEMTKMGIQTENIKESISLYNMVIRNYKTGCAYFVGRYFNTIVFKTGFYKFQNVFRQIDVLLIKSSAFS